MRGWKRRGGEERKGVQKRQGEGEGGVGEMTMIGGDDMPSDLVWISSQ